MTPTPQDSGFDVNPYWAAMVALGAVIVAWAKRFNPKPMLNAFVEYTAGPVMDKRNAPLVAELKEHGHKLERVVKILDRIPEAVAASDAIRAEEAAKKERWGT